MATVLGGTIGIMVLHVPPADASGTVLYVSSTGTDTGNCESAASPCATITYALTIAWRDITIEVSGTVEGGAAVTGAITVEQQPGGEPAVIQEQGTSNVFAIDTGASLSLSGVTIEGGGGGIAGAGITNDGTVNIVDSTITDNQTQVLNAQGGGIWNAGSATIDDSTISDNVAGAGAGIYNKQGTLSVTGSVIDGNSGVDGAGIYNGGGTVNIGGSTIGGNTASGQNVFGGGIDNESGSTTITGSTISGNQALGVLTSQGGGVFNGGNVSITNSTIYGNSLGSDSVGSPGGGGIFNGQPATALITDSTISDNTAPTGSGGGIANSGYTTTALFGDVVASPGGSGLGGECYGTMSDLGYNVDDDGTCGLSAIGSVSDSLNIDSFLVPLANNGGPTETVALLPGSLTKKLNPAQAAIPGGSIAPGQTTPVCRIPDQRGVSRPAPCAMGAYSLDNETPRITSSNSTTFAIGVFNTFTVTAVGIPGGHYLGLSLGTSLLPAGVTFVDNGNGTATLSGTPAFTSGGVYNLTITANNGAPSAAEQNFRLTILSACSTTGVRAPVFRSGYWLAGANGSVYSCGDASFYGSLATLGITPNQPIVGMASTPDGRGYWLVASDGGIFAFGDAAFYGSMGGKPLNDPIVGMAATPGGGYYEVASDGGIFSFGPGATFYGSMGGKQLNEPVVGLGLTLGGGYYEVASDGGIFSFGPGATFYGSMGGKQLNEPVVGMAAAPDGKGYWLVAGDGGIFAFGDAAFYGSTGGKPLNDPIVGMAATPGGGYYEVGSDGGIFAFGDSVFAGSMGGQGVEDIVGMATT